MNPEITVALTKIEIHARVLMDLPGNEQNIGTTQAVVSAALMDIKQCLEALLIEIHAK